MTKRSAIVRHDGSVACDTRVWIRQKAASQLVAIRDVCALPDSEYETIAVDRDSLQLRWARVTNRLTQRVGTKRCFRITLERGQAIDIAEDHSLFTIGCFGELMPLHGSRIRVGTPLVVPFDLSDFKDSWVVDLPTIDLRNVDPNASPDPTTSIVETDGSLTNRLRRTRFPLDLLLTDDFRKRTANPS